MPGPAPRAGSRACPRGPLLSLFPVPCSLFLSYGDGSGTRRGRVLDGSRTLLGSIREFLVRTGQRLGGGVPWRVGGRRDAVFRGREPAGLGLVDALVLAPVPHGQVAASGVLVSNNQGRVGELSQIRLDVGGCTVLVRRPQGALDEPGVVDAAAFVVDMGPQSDEGEPGSQGELVGDGEAGEELGLDRADAGHVRGLLAARAPTGAGGSRAGCDRHQDPQCRRQAGQARPAVSRSRTPHVRRRRSGSASGGTGTARPGRPRWGAGRWRSAGRTGRPSPAAAGGRRTRDSGLHARRPSPRTRCGGSRGSSSAGRSSGA